MKYKSKDKVICTHQDLGKGPQDGVVIGFAYRFDEHGKCTDFPDMAGTPGDVYTVKLNSRTDGCLVHEMYMKSQGIPAGDLKVGQVAIYVETGATVIRTVENRLLILKHPESPQFVGDSYFLYEDGSQTFAPNGANINRGTRYYEP